MARGRVAYITHGPLGARLCHRLNVFPEERVRSGGHCGGRPGAPEGLASVVAVGPGGGGTGGPGWPRVQV